MPLFRDRKPEGETSIIEPETPESKGPERPTLVEWVIGLLPIPYWVAVLLLAVILGYPGNVLVDWLDGLDPAVAGAVPPGGSPFFFILENLVRGAAVIYILWVIWYMRTQLVRAEAAIAPLLPFGRETYHQAFGRVSSFWPPAVIGIGVLASFIPIVGLEALVTPTGFFRLIFDLIVLFFVAATFGSFLWLYVSAFRGIHFLGRLSLKTKPFYEDPMLGLRPLGSLSLSLALPFLLGPVLIALWFSVTRPPLPLTAFVIPAALVGVGIVMFFLPLNGVRRQMLVARWKARRSVQSRLRRFVEDANGSDTEAPDESGTELATLLARLADAFTLDMVERKANAIFAWPFDTRILGRLGVAVGTVVTTLFVTVAITLIGL